jgi:hypothetical protein
MAHFQMDVHCPSPSLLQFTTVRQTLLVVAGKKGISANLLLLQWNIYLPKEDPMLPLVLACLTVPRVQQFMGACFILFREMYPRYGQRNHLHTRPASEVMR